MLTIDPHDAIVFARERAYRLREDATQRPSSNARRALAASLRRAARRLDSAPVVARSA